MAAATIPSTASSVSVVNEFNKDWAFFADRLDEDVAAVRKRCSEAAPAACEPAAADIELIRSRVRAVERDLNVVADTALQKTDDVNATQAPAISDILRAAQKILNANAAVFKNAEARFVASGHAYKDPSIAARTPVSRGAVTLTTREARTPVSAAPVSALRGAASATPHSATAQPLSARGRRKPAVSDSDDDDDDAPTLEDMGISTATLTILKETPRKGASRTPRAGGALTAVPGSGLRSSASAASTPANAGAGQRGSSDTEDDDFASPPAAIGLTHFKLTPAKPAQALAPPKEATPEPTPPPTKAAVASMKPLVEEDLKGIPSYLVASMTADFINDNVALLNAAFVRKAEERDAAAASDPDVDADAEPTITQAEASALLTQSSKTRQLLLLLCKVNRLHTVSRGCYAVDTTML